MYMYSEKLLYEYAAHNFILCKRERLINYFTYQMSSYCSAVFGNIMWNIICSIYHEVYHYCYYITLLYV